MKIVQVSYFPHRKDSNKELQLETHLIGVVEPSEEKFFFNTNEETKNMETNEIVDTLLSNQESDFRDSDLYYIMYPHEYITPDGAHHDDVGDFFVGLVYDDDLAVITNIIELAE